MQCIVRLLALLVTIFVARTALAGCEKDTDCKGTRVCEKGVCVADPEVTAIVVEEPEEAGRAMRRGITSVVFSPVALIGAGAGAFFGVYIAEGDDDAWPALAITELTTLAVAMVGIGVGLDGVLIVRRALKGERGIGLLTAGGALAIVGVLGIVANTVITFVFNEDNEASVINGVLFAASVGFASTGGTLLGLDAMFGANQLRQRAIEVEETEEEWTLRFGPLLLREGAGVQMTAAF